MGDAKDRYDDAQVTRQVTAGPRPWWERLGRRPIVPPVMPPPLPEGVTPALLARYEDEMTDLTFGRKHKPWEHAGPRNAVLHAQILINDAWGVTPPTSDAVPAQSARHAAPPARRDVTGPEPTLLLVARGMPMPEHPKTEEIDWITQSRAILRIEWAAREDCLDDVLLAAMLSTQRFHLRVTMHVPPVYVWQQFDENQVLALGRRLGAYVCQELHLPRAEVIIEASMQRATVRKPTWDVVVWLDEPQDMAGAA